MSRENSKRMLVRYTIDDGSSIELWADLIYNLHEPYKDRTFREKFIEHKATNLMYYKSPLTSVVEGQIVEFIEVDSDYQLTHKLSHETIFNIATSIVDLSDYIYEDIRRKAVNSNE